MTRREALLLDRDAYIAVFDSGVGGISVLRELRRQMPQERFYYFGDNANAPYGLRSTQEVRALTMDAAQRLFDLGAKALVVACNTATAAAISQLRQRWPERIIIGIEPAVKLACDRYPGGTVGIMATNVTLREQKLAQLTARCSRDCEIVLLPSPGVVELVEAGKGNSPEAVALMERELSPYLGRLQALVLGCTHYPFLKSAIRQVVGPEVALLDGSEGTARETHRRLLEADLLRQGLGSVTLDSSDPEKIPLMRYLLEGDAPIIQKD